MEASGLMAFLILSIVVKVTVDLVKGWLDTDSFTLPEGTAKVAAIAVGVVVGLFVAWNTGTGLLTLLGFSVKTQFGDVVLTGLLLAGGSEVAHELVSAVRSLRGEE